MAEPRNVGDGLTANDGKGFLDNEGLVDSLIVDCNNAVKELTNGQYIAFCDQMVQMVRKLANLKKGIVNDMKSKDEQIKDLNELINIKDRTIDALRKKDGETNGKD